MIVREVTDDSHLPAVNAAPRALVFLTVPWSGPERSARVAFHAAAETLANESPELAIQCFSLDEDAPWCQSWLAGLALPQFGGGYPLGAGSLVWLEFGRALGHEIGCFSLKPKAIVARTRGIWASVAEPRVPEDRGGMSRY